MSLIENQRAGFDGGIYRLDYEERADIREGLVREIFAKVRGL